MADVDPRLQVNAELEAKVREMGELPLHPVVEKIQHRFGVFNVIRNARNQKQVDLGNIDQQG